jgi:serine/threonine-protein kinase
MPVISAVVFIAGRVMPASAASELTFENNATGYCLDSNYDGNVYSLPCNGGNYQVWNFTSNPNGGVYIQDAQTGWCLYSDGSGNISTWYCTSALRGEAWYA